MFFRSSWLLPGFHSNFIVLIPKTPNADTITNFRPIALANFVFKIIPKLIESLLLLQRSYPPIKLPLSKVERFINLLVWPQNA